MGESFLGLPNRFKVINNLLETTYNPNHILSAYQGNVLATEYMNRIGGTDYSMKGPLYTESMMPNKGAYYGNYGSLDGSDIGSNDARYRYIYGMYFYGESFVGNASSASRLNQKIDLNVTGAVYGSTSFDGSGNIELNLVSTHDHGNLYLPTTGGSMTGNIKLDGYGIGLIDKNGRQILVEDDSSTTYIGRGPYIKNTGGLSLYSNGYMTLNTKQDEIRLNIESSTHAPFKPYISIGADSTGAYVKYSLNASRLYLGNNQITYNGYTMYHSGNLKLSDYSTSDHRHDDAYLLLSGGNMKGNIGFISSSYGITDTNGRQILGFYPTGVYSINIGSGLRDNKISGRTNIYSRKYATVIQSYDTHEALRMKTDGPSTIVVCSDSNGSEFASEYYSGSTLHRNSLRVPCTTQEDLTYNGYTVYHSGNLDYAKSNHTHEYIPISDKYQPNTITHSDYNNNQGRVATLNFLSYWNGAYNSTGKSNLAYCNRGAFGTIVTKNVGDFLASSGSVSLSGNLTVGSTAENSLKTYTIHPPVDQACIQISRTGSEYVNGKNVGQFLDAAIDDVASDFIVATSMLKGLTSGSNGTVTIGIDSKSTASEKGLRIKYVTKNIERLDSNGNIIGASYTVGNYADIYCNQLVGTGSIHGTKGVFSSTVTATSFKTTSDIRLKKDIHPIDVQQSVNILSRLSPVSYKYKDDRDDTTNRGLIAQQLKEIMMNEHCEDQVYSKLEDGNMSIDYIQLIPDIINVLKYLLYKVDKESCFDEISKSLELDEIYYREHAEEIAKK